MMGMQKRRNSGPFDLAIIRTTSLLNEPSFANMDDLPSEAAVKEEIGTRERITSKE